MQVNSLLKTLPASLVLALSLGLAGAPVLAQNASGGGTGAAAGTTAPVQNVPNSTAQINAAQSQAQQATQTQINQAAQTNRQAVQQSQARNQNQINAAQARNAAQVNQTQARGTAGNNVQTNPPQNTNQAPNNTTTGSTNTTPANTTTTPANTAVNNTASNSTNNNTNLTPNQSNSTNTTAGVTNTPGNQSTGQNLNGSSTTSTGLAPNTQPKNTGRSQNTSIQPGTEPGPILDTQAQIIELDQEVLESRELISSQFPKTSRPGLNQDPTDSELDSETSVRFKDDANDAEEIQQADFLFLWSIALFLMASTLGVAYMVYRKRQDSVL